MPINPSSGKAETKTEPLGLGRWLIEYCACHISLKTKVLNSGFNWKTLTVEWKNNWGWQTQRPPHPSTHMNVQLHTCAYTQIHTTHMGWGEEENQTLLIYIKSNNKITPNDILLYSQCLFQPSPERLPPVEDGPQPDIICWGGGTLEHSALNEMSPSGPSPQRTPGRGGRRNKGNRRWRTPGEQDPLK